jgi:(S)-ureidoglycine-glyoxylate aminotransferase
MIYSNYFDLGMVMDYWGPERLNHHTEATTALFGARECARLILQEGLDNGIARHKLHGDALVKGIQAMGLETFGDLKHKMNNVLGVVIPQGINGDQARKLMLEDFGIEIGTSFGPLHGKVWRIGTMGNARKDCVMTTLSALESVLNYLKFSTTRARRCRPRGITIAARAPNDPRQQARNAAGRGVMARADELAAISETPDA